MQTPPKSTAHTVAIVNKLCAIDHKIPMTGKGQNIDNYKPS